MVGPILQLQGVTKSFGGLRVCDDLYLNVLIGPNGADKATLLNLVTGLLQMDSGGLCFKGTDITKTRVYARAQFGMARSFQITAPFQGFTVQENVSLAVQATLGSGYRFCNRAGSAPA